MSKYQVQGKIIIYQDEYSQMMVYNILRDNIRESEKGINQSDYKHEMKINFNMAIGLFKKHFIYVMTIRDDIQRVLLTKRFLDKIRQYIIPVRNGRKTIIRVCHLRNKHSLNTAKSF